MRSPATHFRWSSRCGQCIRAYPRRPRRGFGYSRGRTGGHAAASHLAPCLAGNRGRHAARLSAGADHVRIALNSRAAGGISCDHDQDLEPLPISAEAWNRGRCGLPAPPRHGHPLVDSAPHSWAAGYTVIGGRRSPRLTQLGPWRWLAFGFTLLILSLTVILPYCALLHAAFAKTVSEPVSLHNFTLHNFRFVLFDFSATQVAVSNTLVLGLASATAGTGIGLIVAYLVLRQALLGARPRLALSRPCPSQSPVSFLASACSLPIRVIPSCSMARFGFC